MENGLVLSDGSADGEIDVTIGSGTSSVTTIAGDASVTGAANITGLLTCSATGDNTISTSSTAKLLIQSSGANGNDVHLGLKSSDTTWLLKTNRGDQISGNQGDFFIREDTAGVNALILETNNGNATFAGTITGTTASFIKDQNADSTIKLYNANSGSAAQATMYITNSSTNADGLFLGSNGTGMTTAGGFVADGAVIGSGTGASAGLAIMARESSSGIKFYTGGHTDLALTIDSSQRLGIGGNPQSTIRLSVRGLTDTSDDYAFEAANSSGNSIFLVRSDGAATFAGDVAINGALTSNIACTITGNSGYEDIMYIKAAGTNIDSRINLIPTGTGNGAVNASANNLELQVAGTERIRVQSNGKTGILHSTPEKLLSIGSSQAEGIQFTYDGSNNYRNQILNYWTSTTDSRMDFNIARSNGATPETILSVGYNQNVGVGTAAPAARLHVVGLNATRNTHTNTLVIDGGTTVAHPYPPFGFGIHFQGDDYSDEVRNYASIRTIMENSHTSTSDVGDPSFRSYLSFWTNSGGADSTDITEKLRITGSGCLNTGTGSLGQVAYQLRVDADTDDGVYVSAGSSSSNHSLYVENAAGSAELFAVRGDGEVRINGSAQGDCKIGTTTDTPSGGGFVFDNAADSILRIGHGSGVGTGSNYLLFYHSTNIIGSITQSGTTATAYNTSSDYRLKEDLKDFNGLDKVSKIPVYDFKWKPDDMRGYGVMAHELQEIIPQAVVGEKDGEQMQGVDYSKLVPILLKSIQELEARVKELENK